MNKREQMSKEVYKSQEVTFGELAEEEITFSDMEMVGMTFGELSSRKMFNSITKMKKDSQISTKSLEKY